MMIPRLFCLAAVLLCCPTLLVAQSSWTMFHGPNRDNVSPETGLLKSWKAEGPPLLWKVNTIGNTEFPGYGSVTIADGRIFIAGNVGTEAAGVSRIFALDEKTGKEIWHYDNGDAWVDKGLFPGERGTPTIDSNRVYVYSSVGRIACLEAATGKEIWARDLRKEYEATAPTWAYAESPFIDGNKVVIWIGGTKAAVVALDKMTGKTIWETPSTGLRGNYCSMTPFTLGERKGYVSMNQSGVFAVDAETGGFLFFVPHKTEWDVMATTPYFFGDKLFVTSGYGTGARLFELNAYGNMIAPTEVWKEPKFDNIHGGIVVKDGYVYASTHYYKRQRNWMCVKLEDGLTAWEAPGIGMGAITSADGMLYCTSEKDPTVALVKATPEKYEETGRFTLPTEEEGGGAGMFWAHPVICNKKLYLRHGKVLYCFDVAEK